jgi:transposase InsO family protein
LIFDRDAKFSFEVTVTLRALGITYARTSFESPWQNGIAERWIESCRRDLLDHIIAWNEPHLKRLMAEYVRYYHADRTHLGLAKQTPGNRKPSTGTGRVLVLPRLGGLHHRYERAA